MPVEAVGIVVHKLARERKPRDMFPVVADAVRHILEATIRHVAKPTRRVALVLHLITLAVRHRLTLTLATLGYAALQRTLAAPEGQYCYC